jgi:hypothetical protein
MIKVNKELEKAWNKVKEEVEGGGSAGKNGTAAALVETLFHFMPDTKICIKDKNGKLIDHDGSFMIHSKDRVELVVEVEK